MHSQNRKLVALIFAFSCTAFWTGASDLWTTNSDKLDRFWAAAEGRQKPVTVVSFGDSMADSYRSPTYHLMNKLQDRLGVAGYSLNNYRNATMVGLDGGAEIVGPGPLWFCGYYKVPSGGSLWWHSEANPGGVYCDQVGIFYVTQPEGGQFKLSVSTNGGPWGTKLLINGHSSTPIGGYTNVSLSPDFHRIRVDVESGTNYVLGPQLLLNHTGGLHAVFADWHGIDLGQVTNVPLSIRKPIFSALQPDLLIWHMKEPTDLGTSNRMLVCESWWGEAAGNCDVLYIGSTWISADETTPLTPSGNAMVRDIALNHQRAYVDLMQPTISYSWLWNNGFMVDGTHLNSAGGLYCANIMWNDLGFFSLGLDRRVLLSKAGGLLQLSYTTSTGAVYRLEHSLDLANWTPLFTNPVGNAVFATNLAPATPHVFYRLGLSPIQ